jgi:FkbM family methyltransferase
LKRNSTKGYEYLRGTHLVDLFKDMNIDMILDVGANVGQYAIMLRNIGFTGEIHSFEPIKAHYEELNEASRADDKWITYNYALGRTSGHEEINVLSGQSSFLEPSELGNDFSNSELGKATRETVEISTLDEFMESHFLGNASVRQRNIYLKMDTQGYDLEVFRGGVRTMEHIVVMQSELALKKLYQDMPDFSDSVSAYQALGFEVTGFYPVSREKLSRAIIEVDCVMVKAGASTPA